MSWHHFGILLAGMVIGGSLGACIMGALAMAGEQSRKEEARSSVSDIGADEVYCMLNKAGCGDIRQGKL